jgi:hypothetical protein
MKKTKALTCGHTRKFRVGKQGGSGPKRLLIPISHVAAARQLTLGKGTSNLNKQLNCPRSISIGANSLAFFIGYFYRLFLMHRGYILKATAIL